MTVPERRDNAILVPDQLLSSGEYLRVAEERLRREILAERMVAEARLSGIEKTIEANDRRYKELANERELRAEQRAGAQREALVVASVSASAALQEAKSAVTIGFEKNNEWRGSINDVIGTRLSRDEYNTAHSALSEKVDNNHSSLLERITSIGTRIDRFEGRTNGISASMSTAIAISAIVISLGMGILTYSSRSPAPAPAYQQNWPTAVPTAPGAASGIPAK